MAFTISSIVRGCHVYKDIYRKLSELPCSPEQIIGKIVIGAWPT